MRNVTVRQLQIFTPPRTQDPSPARRSSCHLAGGGVVPDQADRRHERLCHVRTRRPERCADRCRPGSARLRQAWSFKPCKMRTKPCSPFRALVERSRLELFRPQNTSCLMSWRVFRRSTRMSRSPCVSAIDSRLPMRWNSVKSIWLLWDSRSKTQPSLLHRFATHPSVIIAATDHRLSGSDTVSVADLAHERLITREDGSGTRLLMEQACLSGGITPRIAMTTDSNETIKQAVMAGMGIAVISRHTIGLELALKLMCVLPVDGFPVLRSWFVVRRKSMPMMPSHRALQNFLVENGEGVISALEAGYRAAAGVKE